MSSNFDVTILKNGSPLCILYFLSRERLISTLEVMVATTATEALVDAIRSRLYQPINPLFLASAISISIIKKHDFQSLLSDYTSGSDLPELEKKLLKVPNFDSEEELDMFLKIETEFVQALYLLPLQLMLLTITTKCDDLVPKVISQLSLYHKQPVRLFRKTPLAAYLRNVRHIPLLKFLALPELISSHKQSNNAIVPKLLKTFQRQSNIEVDGSSFRAGINHNQLLQPDPSSSLAQCWEQLKSYDIPEDWKFDRFLVLYYSWVVFNPLYLAMGMGNPPMPKYEDSDTQGHLMFQILKDYLTKANSIIHNNINYYEYELSILNNHYNAILKSNVSKEEKKAALIQTRQRLTNVTGLLRRAHRFYQWIPEEIFAHRMEVLGLQSFLRNNFWFWSEDNERNAERHFRTLLNYGE